MNKYIFIAYKPDSADYCRGCHMGSYSSDFILADDITEKELIEKWAEALYRNETLDSNEVGFDIYVFTHGCLWWNNGCPTCCPDEDIEGWEDDIDALHDKAEKLCKHMVAAKKEAEALAAKKTKEKQAAEDKERRRKEYEKLSKEFNIPTSTQEEDWSDK